HLEGTLAWTNAECCVAYNLMKLQRHVFGWTADARWMDAYERALFNCRLGTQNAQGLKQYFFPLAAGYWRSYNSPEESFWCCTGTGAEEFAKFADTIYFRRGRDIFVNQFIASTLTWKDEDLVFQQVTQFPREQSTSLKIKSSRPTQRAIHVRIPSWTTEDAQVKINGRPIEAIADPGSYLSIRRIWQDGDTISINLPMKLRQEPLPGDDSVAAALYGPLVLAADLGPGPADGPMRVIHGRDTVPKDLPVASAMPKVAGAQDKDTKHWIQVESATELEFTCSGEDQKYDLMPMYRIQDQRYSIYWQTGNSKQRTELVKTWFAPAAGAECEQARIERCNPMKFRFSVAAGARCVSPDFVRAIPVLLILSGTVGVAAQMPGQKAPGPPPAQVEQTSHGIRATAGNEVLEVTVCTD